MNADAYCRRTHGRWKGAAGKVQVKDYAVHSRQWTTYTTGQLKVPRVLQLCTRSDVGITLGMMRNVSITQRILLLLFIPDNVEAIS
jgi:hypothetical protein